MDKQSDESVDGGTVGDEDGQLLFVRDALTEELSSWILFMVLQKIDKNLEKSWKTEIMHVEPRF